MTTQIVSTHSDEYWLRQLKGQERILENWKRKLKEMNRQQGEREQFMRDNSDAWRPEGKPYVLDTRNELRAYVLGVVAAFSIFLGRGVTNDEVEKTLHYDDRWIAAHLSLGTLNDWDAIKLLPLTPAGLTEWGLVAPVVVSDEVRDYFDSL